MNAELFKLQSQLLTSSDERRTKGLERQIKELETRLEHSVLKMKDEKGKLDHPRTSQECKSQQSREANNGQHRSCNLILVFPHEKEVSHSFSTCEILREVIRFAKNKLNYDADDLDFVFNDAPVDTDATVLEAGMVEGSILYAIKRASHNIREQEMTQALFTPSASFKQRLPPSKAGIEKLGPETPGIAPPVRGSDTKAILGGRLKQDAEDPIAPQVEVSDVSQLQQTDHLLPPPEQPDRGSVMKNILAGRLKRRGKR